MPKGVFERSPEHRAAIGAALRGRKRPDVSARLKGAPMPTYERTPEHRALMSEVKRGLRPKRKKDLAYLKAHYLVRQARGPATQFDCVDCGGRAAEWSYRHGSGYSENPGDYDPRCVRCHRAFDLP